MLEFEPKTEDQVMGLLQDGIYKFKVLKSSPHVSNTTGNKSIKLLCQVEDKELLCYLSVGYIKLLKHFCDTTGLEDKYQSGTLSASDCANKEGYCKIITNMQEDTAYDPKNEIKDFVNNDKLNAETKSEVKHKESQKDNDFIDSDLPF